MGNRVTVTSVTRSSRYYHHSFLAARQNGHTFSRKKPSLIRSPINTANFFWPIGDRLTDSIKIALGIGNWALGMYRFVVTHANHRIVLYAQTPNALLLKQP